MIKLLPEQVAKLWKFIRYGIAETFVVRDLATNEVLESYLSSLLTGQRQAWVLLNKDKDIIAVLITRVCIEGLTNLRILSLDHLYAYAIVPQEDWDSSFEVLAKFAKANECRAITSMTTNARVVGLASLYGFKEISYLVKEV